jgi:hypothetical protein
MGSMNKYIKFIPAVFIIVGVGLLVVALLMFVNKSYFGAIFLGFIGVMSIVNSIKEHRNIARGTYNIEYDISLPRSGRMSANVVNGVAEVIYAPGRKYTKIESQFLEEVARFSAKTMDRIGKNEHIKRINVWAMGNIPLDDGSGKRVWKGVRLVLDKSSWQGPVIGDLLNYAYLDRAQFLRLCSLQYIDASEFPEWPKKIDISSPV